MRLIGLILIAVTSFAWANEIVVDGLPDIIEVRTGTRASSVTVIPQFSHPSCGSEIAIENDEHSLIELLVDARASYTTVRLVVEDLDPTVRDACWLRRVRSW